MDLRADDLFGVATSIAELLGAPVTIEDPDTIVVAYSGGAQGVDEARIDTILSRQVPLRYRTALAKAGVFERLRASDDVIYVELPEEHMTPRAVIAVREGTLLGSIWAAVHGAPTVEQELVLTSAAPIVARLIIQERERTDSSRKARQEVLSRLFAGDADSLDCAREQGLHPPFVVAALSRASAQPGHGLTGTVALHLGAVSPRSVSARIGDTTYAVIGADEANARRILTDFLARTRSDKMSIAIGREVDSARLVARSRADADLVLRAMVGSSDSGGVASMRDRFADALAQHVESFATEFSSMSPLAALQAHDRSHDTHLVEAAAAYLECGGDVAAAATQIHVHPNTMRNRIDRAARSCGVDLHDADTRLALMMVLKVSWLGE